jgi:hypothetical protein
MILETKSSLPFSTIQSTHHDPATHGGIHQEE